MSYIPGKSFQQLVQEGHRFKQSQLRRWGMQLCSALDYLHNQKPPIIHSDIKPANIMLTPQGNICLIDFNISFFLDGTAIVGYTHGYSSPEQKSIAFHENKEGIVVDDKTDIYSVGAVFYYLITGEKINYENNDLINRELLEKKVSQSFANIIYRAIAYKKEDRFQSANEMLKAFRQIPQNDKRYQKVVKMHKISMITAGSLLVVSIVLGGLGIHELKLEKVEKYNSLVQQQINYRQKKNYKKEEKAYKEAIKIIPDSLESYYQNALAIYEKGDYKECLDFISYDIELNEKVNMLQKGNADVMYVKACSYFELGNYKQAIKSYEQLFRYRPPGPARPGAGQRPRGSRAGPAAGHCPSTGGIAGPRACSRPRRRCCGRPKSPGPGSRWRSGSGSPYVFLVMASGEKGTEGGLTLGRGGGASVHPAP